MTLGQKNLWATVATGAGKDVFQLREMWGDEFVSRPYRYELELLSNDSAVDFKKVVGQPGFVTLTYPSHPKRYFHGIVTRLRQGATDRGRDPVQRRDPPVALAPHPGLGLPDLPRDVDSRDPR